MCQGWPMKVQARGVREFGLRCEVSCAHVRSQPAVTGQGWGWLLRLPFIPSLIAISGSPFVFKPEIDCFNRAGSPKLLGYIPSLSLDHRLRAESAPPTQVHAARYPTQDRDQLSMVRSDILSLEGMLLSAPCLKGLLASIIPCS